jgi:hypothetical protein
MTYKERTVAETIKFLQQCKRDEVVKADEAGTIYVDQANGYTRAIVCDGRIFEIPNRRAPHG